MLGAADPSWYSTGERPGPETTIGTIMESAGRRAESELAGQPDVLGDVLWTLGRANQALRKLDLARAQLERALELHLRTLGPASPKVASDEHELGMLSIAAGDFVVAERWLRQALDRFRAAGDSLSDVYGRTVADLGLVVLNSGRAAEAEGFIRASAKHRWRFDSTSAANFVLLGNLGLALSQQGKLDSAEQAYRAALAGFDRLKPREFFEKGFTLGNLAVDFIYRGRPAEAVPLARDQIAYFSKFLGPTHPNVAYGWVNLARSLHATGDELPALESAQKAEALFKGAGFPAEHPDFARTEAITGQILTSLGRLPEAERRLRNALAIRRAKLAPGSDRILEVEVALGALLVRNGGYSEAESLLSSAVRVYRARSKGGDLRGEHTVRSLVELCRASQSKVACSYRDSLPPESGRAPEPN